MIESESQQRLVAVPCEHGSAIAVFDGKDISLVECGQISTPQAVRAYVAERLAAIPNEPGVSASDFAKVAVMAAPLTAP